MSGMCDRHADIARIGAIVFKIVKSRIFYEPVELFKIFETPFASYAWRVSEHWRFAGGHYYVICFVYLPACKQAVPSECNALAVSIFCKLPVTVEVCHAGVFNVKAASER